MLTDMLKRRHAYPPAVAGLLAEAVALTAMLGTSLKIDGKFILQTKTDGPVDMLVVDFSTTPAEACAATPISMRTPWPRWTAVRRSRWRSRTCSWAQAIWP